MEQTAPEAVRREMLGVAALHRTLNERVLVRGERLQIPLEGRELGVVLYRQPEPGAPVLFGCHGGGFALGGCALDDRMWAALAERTGCTVVSVGYRLAPEHRFPCPVYDVYETVRYFADRAANYGWDREKFLVIGASAGANLAAAAAILDNREGTRLIRKQLLLYPYLDLASPTERAGHPDWEAPMYDFFRESYASTPEERADPLCSPVCAGPEDLRGLPETLIVRAERDPLRHEDLAYAGLLRAAGVPVREWTAAGMEHGYFEFNYSLQDTPPEQAYCPDSMKQSFLDGSMARETERTLDELDRFIHS